MDVMQTVSFHVAITIMNQCAPLIIQLICVYAQVLSICLVCIHVCLSVSQYVY